MTCLAETRFNTILSKRKRNTLSKLKRNIPLHFMVLIPFAFVFVYNYLPMAGIIIAFQNFVPIKGLFGDQQWVGFANFRMLFKLNRFWQVFGNTLEISSMKIIVGLVVPITLALLLNEVYITGIKRTIQTLIYMPYFLSWVILSGVLVDILSPQSGIINQLIKLMGFKEIYFLGSNSWFQFTVIITEIWKNAGFATIVYLATLAGISQELHEAAIIDGANRFQRAIHVSLPGMTMVIVLLSVLSLGSILNAGFDQVFNLYSPTVYETGDILDTMVYRVGLLEAKYGLATAAGLFKSVISLLLLSVSYILAYKIADYRIF